MRILMTSDFYPPILGGMERHVQTLARALQHRGHEVAVATLSREGSPEFEVDEGVRVYRLSGWNRVLAGMHESRERQFHPTVPDPGVMRGLHRILDREQPDIVHARGWMLYSVLPLKRTGSWKLVVTLHDYSLVCVRKTYFRRRQTCTGASFARCVRCAAEQYGLPKAAALTAGLFSSSHLHNMADRYIAISSAVRDASLPGTDREIEVIPTFVPDGVVDEGRSIPRPAFLPSHEGYLLYVGDMSHHKGVDVLLEAYSGLSREVPLVILGIEHGQARRHLPREVVSAWNVPHTQVMAAWRHAGIGVVPSLWPEPFGQVAVEAMLSGRPVVASAVGGLPDVVLDGVTGVLVPPGDPAALRAAIQSLLHDPVRARRMGKAGQERGRLFTVSAVVDRIERLYRTECSGRQAG